ncbi:aldo/keto reductase [Variovorax sp. J22R133]|uniref:aldo/keto reductase n=1 Tax=Variovorax brevis TaxID=3053503 RepID=UPI0025790591|nr:aldo/keto reductase [Variovorax sp. J22R133]MDM0112641.1 aldo/keto reductase [Variovorax sp. J22R133]
MRITLNDGRSKPQPGLGTWPLPSSEAAAMVASALRAGCRAIDTAAVYANENGVGEGIHAAGVPRSDLFVTTKLAPAEQGFDPALRAVHDSLQRLGLDEVDLYLIHWPAPQSEVRLSTWRALIKMREAGLARSIGVSNFTEAHIQELIDQTGVTPAVNQVELHPAFQQRRLRALHDRHAIVTESWSPLARGNILGDPVIASVAAMHHRTPAQIILRWHLDNGLSVVPRTRSPEHWRQNLDVLNFQLDSGDIEKMKNLDDPKGRIGPDPDWG